MPNRNMGRQGQGAGAPAAGTPPAGADPESGIPPLPPSGTAGIPPVNEADPPTTDETAGADPGGAATTPAGTGDDNPAAGTPPAGAAHLGNGKKRVKCAALKGGKIIVGKGDPVQIDKEGFFEVSEAEAARLLTIPGYEEA